MRFTGLISFLAGIVPVVVSRLKGGPPGPNDASEIPDPTADRVEQYGILGGTESEIADRFDVEATTLRADFERVLKVSRALHKLSVRRAQYDLAMKGNGPMLIWLGRNVLGQSSDPQTPGIAEPTFEEKTG